MGGKRHSPEEIVVNFFQTADVGAITAVFRIVQSIVKNRVPKAPKTGTKRKVKQPDSRQALIPESQATPF